ncbi:uncharacterized protein LOC129602252 [Paramacrobiotus metropolitanus]|uniref:uncharacterized protein LOC129602252 n=1 Tax=Paramacrobiotus metropolitanus TaxID=2943436 RepID=UPI0024458097|nr:uncharacterized protein LOC129602252 [Paramacrobiotus metropolitanus]
MGHKYRRCSRDLPEHVEKWTFVKRTLRVPEHLVAPLARVLSQKFAGCSDVGSAKAEGVEVADGWCGVVYIQRRWYAEAATNDTSLKYEQDSLNKLHSALIASAKRLREPLADTSPVEAFAVLPTELWTEVFSCLDTVTQTKLRRVCPTWNAILDSPYLMGNLVFDTLALTRDSRSGNHAAYFIISALFKFLTRSTQHLLLADRKRRLGEMGVQKVLHIFNFITQRSNGIRVKAIVLVGLELCLVRHTCNARQNLECPLHPPLSGDSDTSFAGQNAIAVWRNLACGSIRLKQCTMTLKCQVRNWG